jgi:hypothetical protein
MTPEEFDSELRQFKQVVIEYYVQHHANLELIWLTIQTEQAMQAFLELRLLFVVHGEIELAPILAGLAMAVTLMEDGEPSHEIRYGCVPAGISDRLESVGDG